MNLAIDIGNTRTKIGVFSQEELLTVQTFDTGITIDLQEIIDKYAVERSIVSSTADIPDYILSMLNTLPQHLTFNHQTRLPFMNLYASGETLGLDRIALIAAAAGRFPGQNTLVIGCGTCITFNFISEKMEFLGGSIHPGLKMRLKAMHHFTGKLPLIELTSDTQLIGNDTVSNLLTGVLYAAAREIDGMTDDYLVKFPQMNIIITGGDAEMLVSRLKNKIFVVPNFTLIGLNHILEYNA
jgi:type III pantothenate kinase